MAALELAKWEGEASEDLFQICWRSQTCGLIHIRETEESYMTVM